MKQVHLASVGTFRSHATINRDVGIPWNDSVHSPRLTPDTPPPELFLAANVKLRIDCSAGLGVSIGIAFELVFLII